MREKSDDISNNWIQIWGNRSVDNSILQSKDEQKLFLELKRCNGFDVLGEGRYEWWVEQYLQVKSELLFQGYGQKDSIKSIYEVGCGSGASLYLFQKDGFQCGGIDYSESLTDCAKKVLRSRDIVCDEAINMPVDNKYDAVYSNSVFQYFSDEKYALEVLGKMYEKAKDVIGIIDIRDKDKEEEYVSFRKNNIENYEDKYRDLPSLFYSKQFFLDFASRHRADIKFTISEVKGYWNNDFSFNCYIYKR